jgi:CubicO group peptidase (beta-lactamase class C family)
MKPRLWFVLLCVIGLVACTSQPSSKQANDGWQTAAPADVGLNESPLSAVVERIQDKRYQNVDSLLIVKDGKLAFEAYFDGYEWDYDSPEFKGEAIQYRPETRHNLASVTKSVTSILVGIALDQGKIQSVDEKMFAFFPKHAHLNNAQKDTITLKHLLTMSSGLAWNGTEVPLSDLQNDIVQLFIVDDPVAHILSKPIVNTPGLTFHYSSGDTNVVGEIIQAATGQRMDIFAEKYLFAPLGISDYAWEFINDDMVFASGDLQLRPRDMAKLGQLYLNGGVWEGKRIVSEAWIAESTQKHMTLSTTSGYGYLWWLDTYRVGSTAVDAFSAEGWGGQRIIVIPDWEMIVVFTGGNYASEDPSEEILTRYILPAVQK